MDSKQRTEALYSAMAQMVMQLWMGVPSNEIFAALTELMVQSILGSQTNVDRYKAFEIIQDTMAEIASRLDAETAA